MIKKDKHKDPSIGQLINELSRVSHSYFQQELKKFQIGHGQIRTLFFIVHHEGLTPKEIADYMKLDKSSLTSQLQLLERNGYIERVTSEDDARKQNIRITDKTKEILPPIKQTFYSWTDSLLEGFSIDDIEKLTLYLKRMRENVKVKLDKDQDAETGCQN